MHFDAMSDNIRGILTNQRIYKIPRFQRDFSWDSSNYSDFFNDILSQITFTKENDSFIYSKYYLGNMLFLGNKDSVEVEVIDGQQRLTTITILLAAIRNLLYLVSKDTENYNENDIKSAKSYADTTQSEFLIKNIDGHYQRKIETSTSYPYFTQTIQDYETGNPNVEPKTEEEELLKESFEWFLKQLKKDAFLKNISTRYSFKFGSEYYIRALKALRDQILESVVVDIFVEDKTQANQIFENINSKGKPLTQVDLIKNVIFNKINITQGAVDEVGSTWENLKKELIDSDTNFNEFFLHYWKAVYPKDSANGNNLYDKFNTKFSKANEDTLKEFIKELVRGFSTYKLIIDPDPKKFTRQEFKSEMQSLVALKYFKAIQVRPALLAFYLKIDNDQTLKFKQSDKTDFLNFISNFHFAAFGTDINLRSNKATGPYKDFIKSINNSSSVQDIKKAIIKLKKDLLNTISKDDFISAFTKLTFSKKLSRQGMECYPANYAIRTIANHLQGRNYDDDEYSIEHIIDESSINLTTHNIGNLTVLETSLNTSIPKDSTFKCKNVFYAKSNYSMVKELLDHQSFNDTDINERSLMLANRFWTFFFSHI